MRVVIARTMQEFSMQVYADGIISGLKTVRPDWEIVDLAPHSFNRTSWSLILRAQKYYERFWHFPCTVKNQVADIFHIIDHSEAHMVHWLRKTGKPVVVTCHDLINYYYRDNLQGSVQLPIVSNGMWLYSVRAMWYANHVVAVSSVTAKDIAKILNIEPARIVVIPNAVDSIFQKLPKHQAESFRQQKKVTPKTICLLNVGSNHPRKNIFTILKVVQILKERGLPIQFWKVGSEFSPEEIMFVKANNIESHVSYLGKPDKSNLVQIYNAADILVAPSLHEGFGITILEAMACGIPIITSNVSALPEVAGDAAILVNPTDTFAIADGVEHIYRNTDYRQNLSEKGIKRAKLFTWEATAEQIARVYERVTK